MSDNVTIGPWAEINSVLTAFASLGVEAGLCGSRVTCNPPPTDTDTDYLVFTPIVFDTDEALPHKVSLILFSAGFSCESFNGSYEGQPAGVFASWRRHADNINMIVSADQDFVRRHRAATAVCTRLNLLDKADRVALFQAVLYGEIWRK